MIDIDDQLLVEDYSGVTQLNYAQPWGEQGDMWPPLLEKGWAKVKGSYENSDEGMLVSGLRSITGNPSFGYGGTTLAEADELFTLLKAADDQNHLLAA